jgi:cephalosporin-C deacetylase-like acetyl esterase
MTIKYQLISFVTMLCLVSGAASAQALHSIETVAFTNGEVCVVGDYYKPTTPGPHPAVVFTHGSGDAGRDNGRYQEEAEYFAEEGIASLVFDKRGYGDSEGDWRTASFEDLALDAIAAVDHLKSRNDVDHSRIGLRGASQSGWVLPVAASKSESIRYLILISHRGILTQNHDSWQAASGKRTAVSSSTDEASATGGYTP